jgi:hypothetical protein
MEKGIQNYFARRSQEEIPLKFDNKLFGLKKFDFNLFFSEAREL